jgi:hypothetical protein
MVFFTRLQKSHCMLRLFEAAILSWMHFVALAHENVDVKPVVDCQAPGYCPHAPVSITLAASSFNDCQYIQFQAHKSPAGLAFSVKVVPDSASKLGFAAGIVTAPDFVRLIKAPNTPIPWTRWTVPDFEIPPASCCGLGCNPATCTIWTYPSDGRSDDGGELEIAAGAGSFYFLVCSSDSQNNLTLAVTFLSARLPPGPPPGPPGPTPSPTPVHYISAIKGCQSPDFCLRNSVSVNLPASSVMHSCRYVSFKMDSSSPVGVGWWIYVIKGSWTGFTAGIVTEEDFESLMKNPWQDIKSCSWGYPPLPPECINDVPYCSNYKYPSSSHELTDRGELVKRAPSGQYYFVVCSYDYSKELHLSFAFGPHASGSHIFMHRAVVLATFVFWFLCWRINENIS